MQVAESRSKNGMKPVSGLWHFAYNIVYYSGYQHLGVGDP